MDDKLIKRIFSFENLDNLHVAVTHSKGGSFVIKPDQGGLILKSINKSRYRLIQEFLPDYYRYQLMNPNTYITPILGVYTLLIKKGGNSLPIYFVLQRNIQGYDRRNLEEDDFTYQFDIKGQIHGRKLLENPRDLLNFEQAQLDKALFTTSFRD